MILSPVAGRNVRATQSRFKLPFFRNELELDTGGRQADVAGPIKIPRARQREWRGLGRAKRRQEYYALTGSLDCQPRQFIPCGLIQSGAGLKEHLEAAEEVSGQLIVGAEKGDQRFITLGYVEIDCRRD